MSYRFEVGRYSAWGLERKVRLLLRHEAGHQLLRASLVGRCHARAPLSPEEARSAHWLIARCELLDDRYRRAIGAARRRLDDLAGDEEVRNES